MLNIEWSGKGFLKRRRLNPVAGPLIMIKIKINDEINLFIKYYSTDYSILTLNHKPHERNNLFYFVMS